MANKPKGKDIQCPSAFDVPAVAGSLFALTGDYLDAQRKLAEIDLDPQTIADTLESLEGDIAVKALRVIAIAQQFDAFAEAIESRLMAMAKRAGASKARAAYLRNYVRDSLIAAGFQAKDKISSPEIVLALQNNPAKVEIEHIEDVPGFYFRTWVAPTAPDPRDPSLLDKKAIKDYLEDKIENGELAAHVPGAKLVQDVRLVEK